MPNDAALERIPTLEDVQRELCARDKVYFIRNFCRIYSTSNSEKAGEWIPFDLWPEQIEVVEIIVNNQKVVILKARQVGLTWLVLAIALWTMLFSPIATILVYSARDTEAIYLLSDDRLRGMYYRLPAFLKVRKDESGQWVPLHITDDDKHLFSLSNGSNIRAFPTSVGDSYTATLAIVDEADNSNDLNRLLQRVQPTIDAGGKLILLSRSYKEKPESTFKKIYRSAKEGLNNYAHAFLPWSVVTSRTQEWYEAQKRDSIAAVGTLDNVWESYPATDAEALAPREQDKRFPSAWLLDCYEDNARQLPATQLRQYPNLPHGLVVYDLPAEDKQYRIGADPAEGNPNSDDSSLCVIEKLSGRQVAKLSGKFEPRVFAKAIREVSSFYHNAPTLVERNNHGHAVILECENLGVTLLDGYDDKPGWLNNKKGKVLLYDYTAEMLRTNHCKITDFRTYSQLASIEASTLLAPDGMADDEADAFCLAQKAATLGEFHVSDSERDLFGRLSL
jgi:hypothetical protein